ncbi:unnamed protein product [Camellia sinensis]
MANPQVTHGGKEFPRHDPTEVDLAFFIRFVPQKKHNQMRSLNPRLVRNQSKIPKEEQNKQNKHNNKKVHQSSVAGDQ